MGRWPWSSGRSSPTGGSSPDGAWSPASSRRPPRPANSSSCPRSLRSRPDQLEVCRARRRRGSLRDHSGDRPRGRRSSGRRRGPPLRCCARVQARARAQVQARVQARVRGHANSSGERAAYRGHGRGPRGSAHLRGSPCRPLGEASHRLSFWLLAGTFFICGWSTNGLIGTHFIPAAHDHGMPPTTAAGLLALIGIFDIAGTVASGWLTDRVDPRLLVGYYVLRGLSLLVVPSVLGPGVEPSLFLFIVFYGLDWVATVPPTMALCRAHFGLERSSIVFGWVFAAHMVGAGIAATFAGRVRQSSGDYFWAWLTAGILCLIAGFACLAIPRRAPEGARSPGTTPDDAGPSAGQRGSVTKSSA
ncbi:MAG: MFS transporter [Actinomycetales bacterium]|uniref:MFS transporter n=1 Tax=Candidatus Phosphoribacter hodrii TaxID=2953743 RepID=A0A9D7Y101_9MICO|nr:MFS transporter [Candidatus Phosphoribacter hodrii]